MQVIEVNNQCQTCTYDTTSFWKHDEDIDLAPHEHQTVIKKQLHDVSPEVVAMVEQRHG